MNPTEPRVSAALDVAMNQIRATAAAVATRVCESLGIQAETVRITERDAMIATQLELRRKAGVFESVFFEALRDKVREEVDQRRGTGRKLASADWQTLTLVEDREVEERMNFERIGQMISHASEWQLRELAAYMGAVTRLGRADEDKNPLRADVIGAALYRGIEAVSDEADHRRILTRELGQAMAQAMPDCYAEILRLMREKGIQPVSLTVRTVEGPGNQLAGVNSGYAGLSSLERPSIRSAHGDLGESTGSRSGIDLMYEHRRAAAQASGSSTSGAATTSRGTHAGSTRGGSHGEALGPRTGEGDPSRGGRPVSRADAQLMDLLRRLTAVASRSGDFDPVPRERGLDGARGYPGPVEAEDSGGPGGRRATALSTRRSPLGSSPTGRSTMADFIRSSPQGAASSSGRGGLEGNPDGEDGLAGLMAVNLIRAHREELMQASTGKLDHMVIDVVGSLFDQILSDSRVPPQMARQIARLQLPVLRVALHDASFFSTRRHPVRRFINRIASLACAFDDFEDGPGKQFLTRVAQLVQEIVEGDFDQLELYASKLAELERFIADQAEGAAEQTGAVRTLASKETELQIQQRYMQQLQAALAPLQLPPYLGNFLPQVWSQALVLATRKEGPDSAMAKRFRRVGCDLVMSIQPKGSPMFRKKFLMQLPPLMKDLNEGMKLIGWPEAAQREFFGKLLPAHAESLKGQSLSELDHNLMVKQLEAIFAMPIPGAEVAAVPVPLANVDEANIEGHFTPEEVKQVGLIEESAVDWSGPVEGTAGTPAELDLNLDLAAPSAAEPAAVAAASDSGDSGADTEPGTDHAPTTGSGEPPETIRGPQLMDHIKLGFAYQMHLKDEWQKVRLAHVSSGRSFFVFTRGAKHQETISMTSRMLARMCETGRMRAVESAYLMERATHRARKQLAEINTRH